MQSNTRAAAAVVVGRVEKENVRKECDEGKSLQIHSLKNPVKK